MIEIVDLSADPKVCTVPARKPGPVRVAGFSVCGAEAAVHLLTTNLKSAYLCATHSFVLNRKRAAVRVWIASHVVGSACGVHGAVFAADLATRQSRCHLDDAWPVMAAEQYQALLEQLRTSNAEVTP